MAAPVGEDGSGIRNAGIARDDALGAMFFFEPSTGALYRSSWSTQARRTNSLRATVTYARQGLL